MKKVEEMRGKGPSFQQARGENEQQQNEYLFGLAIMSGRKNENSSNNQIQEKFLLFFPLQNSSSDFIICEAREELSQGPG